MIELLTTSEIAEADRLAIEGGISGIDLMESAGRAVADTVARGLRGGGRVAILAGPGNNGGDGFVAAQILAERGCRVHLLLVCSANPLKGDAAVAARRFRGPIEAATPE